MLKLKISKNWSSREGNLSIGLVLLKDRNLKYNKVTISYVILLIFYNPVFIYTVFVPILSSGAGT